MLKRSLIWLFFCFSLFLSLLVSCADAPSVETFATRADRTGLVWSPSVYPSEAVQIIGAFAPREETVVIAVNSLSNDWNAPFRAIGQEKQGPIRLIYETLVEFDYASQRFYPVLAESWFVSGEELMITLPEGRTWQDGNSLTAADVVYTVGLKQRIERASGGTPLFWTAEEIDEKTIRITHTQTGDNRDILWDLANLLIVPAHIFERLEAQMPPDRLDRLAQIADPQMIGSGPYRLRTNDEFIIRLEAVDPDVPPFIEVPRYGDEESCIDAFRRGHVDIYYGKAQLSEADEIYSGREMLYGIFLNAERLPLRDIAVRRALLMSVRNTLVAGALFEQETEYSPFQYFLNSEQVLRLDVNKLLPGVPVFDPDESARIMEEAGYVRTDGFYRLKGDAVLTAIYVNGRREQAAMAVLKNECESAGFRLYLKPLSPVAYEETRRNRSYDVALDTFAVGDSSQTLQMRIESLAEAFVRPILVNRDEALTKRLETLINRITPGGIDNDSSAVTELSEELQNLSVYLALGAQPEQFMNIRHDTWRGDLSFLSEAGVWSDPFGPKALRIFRSLKRRDF
jgi:ABC-type transport system substrate-binding protein